MKTGRLAFLLTIIGVMLVVGIAQAGSSANYAIPWEVVGRGGNEMSSPHYTIRSTTGQAIIGPGQSSSYHLGAGYWYGFGDVITPSYYSIHLPLLLKND
jgi:hypothetical protein